MSRFKQLFSFPIAIGLLSPALLAAGGRVHTHEKDMCMQPPVTTQPMCNITPYVAPEVIDRVNVTTAADFIWWDSYVGGMEFAISGVDDGDPATADSVLRGKVKKPPFQWSPGIKLAVGCDYRLDGWNTTARYTGLFSDRGHGSVSYDATKGLGSNFPVQFSPGFFGIYGVINATCSWRQKFNVVDVELARNFFISKTLSLRPHFGLKGSWIEERFGLNYKIKSQVLENVFTNTNIEMCQRQWGLGIRGGVNTVWHIIKEFGIYGDISAAAMWSSFKTHIDSVNTITDLGTPTFLNTDGRLFEVLPVLELGLGIEYTQWFHNDTCLFFARAGWEEQIWSDFNQFVFPLDRLHGNLSLQGLTIEAGFTF